MKTTQVKIIKNKHGNRIIEVVNDELTAAEKTQIKYSIYMNMNESHAKLLKFLPQDIKEGNK